MRPGASNRVTACAFAGGSIFAEIFIAFVVFINQGPGHKEEE
jgi:hypothetical protein